MSKTRFVPIFLLVVSAVFSLALTSHASQADFVIGVAPPVVDLGELQKGTTKIVRFNIVTPSDDPILVYLDKLPGRVDFFSSTDERLPQFSEEDVTSWVDFVDNPVEVSVDDKPEDVDVGNRGLREIRFVLQVPADAEPGYHVFNVIPRPVLPDETISGAGARVVSVTVVSFVFKVPGDAYRDGVILDTTQGGYVGGSLQVNTFFRNTGTVSFSANSVQKFDRDGIVIDGVTSGVVTVKPGETTTLQTQLQPADSVPGQYDVNTKVFFTTGSVEKDSVLTVAEPPPEPEARPVAPVQTEEGLPLYIIIIVVVVIVAVAVGIYLWHR